MLHTALGSMPYALTKQSFIFLNNWTRFESRLKETFQATPFYKYLLVRVLLV